MKAMILCAGYGRRLRPITDTKPKALLYVDRGLCLLEIVIRRLKFFGFDDIVINLHYLSEQIIGFLERKNNFGVKISFSYEKERLLDTGGAIKQAYDLLREDNDDPFLLCNVDILSKLDLGAMYRRHLERDILATVAVQDREQDKEQDREMKRGLFFDRDLLLSGWKQSKEKSIFIKKDKLDLFSFSGIHVISMDIFKFIGDKSVFSIIEFYLSLARKGYAIKGYDHSDDYCVDAGTFEALRAISLLGIELAPL